MKIKLNQSIQKGLLIFLLLFSFLNFNTFNAYSSEAIDETSKKWSESAFTEAEILSSKESYQNLLKLTTGTNQAIEALYGNNVKAWYTIRNLQQENTKLKKQLETLQEAVRKINNNLFQMQQRLEIQKSAE